MHRHHHHPGGRDQAAGERVFRLCPHAQGAEKESDLVTIVTDTLVLYREAHKHIEFSTDIGVDIPLFSFDPIQIKRVLINLLDNAVGVLAEGGIIHITLRRTRDSVQLSVADSGPGISEYVKTRLFEPYFSTRKSGTGLGLAITHTIVAEHNGTIIVHDNVPSGTIFTVELPLDS